MIPFLAFYPAQAGQLAVTVDSAYVQSEIKMIRGKEITVLCENSIISRDEVENDLAR